MSMDEKITITFGRNNFNFFVMYFLSQYSIHNEAHDKSCLLYLDKKEGKGDPELSLEWCEKDCENKGKFYHNSLLALLIFVGEVVNQKGFFSSLQEYCDEYSDVKMDPESVYRHAVERAIVYGIPGVSKTHVSQGNNKKDLSRTILGGVVFPDVFKKDKKKN